MDTVVITSGRQRDASAVLFAELHTLQVFVMTRLDLAVSRARELLGAERVAAAAALEIADLLRVAATAASRSATVAQELRKDAARIAGVR